MDMLATTSVARPADFVVGADGRITRWSDRAANTFSLPADHAVGRLCAQVVRGLRDDGSPYCRWPCPWLVPAAGTADPEAVVHVRTGIRFDRPSFRIRHVATAPGAVSHWLEAASASEAQEPADDIATPLTVADVMAAPVVSASPLTSYRDIVRKLHLHRVHAVAVVAEGGRPLGIVAETDLLRKLEGPLYPARFERKSTRLRRARAQGTTAAELMSTPFPAVTAHARLGTAARRMRRLKVEHLGVLDDAGRLVGMVGALELLKGFLRPDEEIARQIRRDLIDGWIADEGGHIRVHVSDGVVQVAGSVQRRSQLLVLRHLVLQLDGVVDVRDEVAFAANDQTRLQFIDRHRS